MSIKPIGLNQTYPSLPKGLESSIHSSSSLEDQDPAIREFYNDNDQNNLNAISVSSARVKQSSTELVQQESLKELSTMSTKEIDQQGEILLVSAELDQRVNELSTGNNSSLFDFKTLDSVSGEIRNDLSFKDLDSPAVQDDALMLLKFELEKSKKKDPLVLMNRVTLLSSEGRVGEPEEDPLLLPLSALSKTAHSSLLAGGVNPSASGLIEADLGGFEQGSFNLESLPTEKGGISSEDGRFLQFVQELNNLATKINISNNKEMVIHLKSEVLEQTELKLSRSSAGFEVSFVTRNPQSYQLLIGQQAQLENHLRTILPTPILIQTQLLAEPIKNSSFQQSDFSDNEKEFSNSRDQ